MARSTIPCALMCKDNVFGSHPCTGCKHTGSCHKTGTKHTMLIQAAIHEDWEGIVSWGGRELLHAVDMLYPELCLNISARTEAKEAVSQEGKWISWTLPKGCDLEMSIRVCIEDALWVAMGEFGYGKMPEGLTSIGRSKEENICQ